MSAFGYAANWYDALPHPCRGIGSRSKHIRTVFQLRGHWVYVFSEDKNQQIRTFLLEGYDLPKFFASTEFLWLLWATVTHVETLDFSSCICSGHS